MGFDNKLNRSNSAVRTLASTDAAVASDAATATTARDRGTRPGRTPSRFYAVLLDVDGTLVDSNDAHAQAWSAACSEFGFDRPVEFFGPLIGMGGDHVLPRVDPALSDNDEPGQSIAKRRGEIFTSSFLPTLRAMPGAQELVEHLRHCGLRCVVASSAKADELEALLEIARVSKYIDVQTTSEDARTSKPAPDIVNVALEKARVAPNEVIFLGDTPYDIRSGQQAGVSVIALRCGGWDDLGLAGAIAIYNDPADLLAQYDASPLGVAR